MRRKQPTAALGYCLLAGVLGGFGPAASRAGDNGQNARPAGRADTAGLVAHYTFDEVGGGVLQDKSGNGNDGRIHGAVYVESPRGHALQFDGQDDYVDLGRNPALNLSGDLTIEAWIKTDVRGLPKRHRLIVGSTAGLTVERNYNLRIDFHNHVRLEWGNGDEWGALTRDASFLDGSWHHLAVVVESPEQCYLFVDGRLVAYEQIDVPIQESDADGVHIGGWGHGFFQGEIDEIRIYNRALSSLEIWRDAGRKPRKYEPKLELHAGYSYHQKSFVCDVFWTSAAEDATAFELRVKEPEKSRAVVDHRAGLPAPTRPGSARWSMTDLMLEAGVEGEGEYRFEAAVVGSDGRVLAEASTRVPVTPPPPWLASKAGVTDQVLSPYTPCTVESDGPRLSVGTWGRRHVFGPTPFLASVESLGSELLARPVRVQCTADGKPESFAPAPPRLSSKSPAEIGVEQTLAGARSRLVVRSRIEYDGFMKVDWRLQADRPLRLDRLTVDIALRAEHAKLLYAWPRLHSGRLKGDWSAPFQPILWIGDEQRGLAWVAESDRNWLPADRQDAIEVIPGEDDLTLRLNLVAASMELKRGETLDYTFALQATPVRPMQKTCWDFRLQRQPPYAHEYKWLNKKIEGMPALEFYARQGARALLVLRWWDAFSYTLPMGHEERFAQLVAACHRHDLEVVPYSIGFLLSEEAPEFKYFRRDMLARPRKPFPVDRLPGMDPQMTYYACCRGAWQDFAVATTAECIDKYDIDGVYLDTTVRPHACRNRLHGCGYVAPDGTVRSTYPVFATRELLKRLYTVVKRRKPDGIVDAHVYDCLNVPSLAFATSYWNGEQLPRRELKTDALPLDRFRTEFMGHNIGVPADVLYYKLGDYEACTGLALLHDVPVRSESERDFAVLASIWRIREGFGCDEAAFVGYWNAEPLVRVEPEGCYASLWRRPDRGALAVVANLTQNPAEVQMEFNLEELQLRKPIAAHDARSGKPLSMAGNRLSLKLEPQAWTLVRLRPE